MSIKVIFKCKNAEQKVFDEIKCIVACDALLIYLYFNKRFDIHMDASDFQIGWLIGQDVKPIAFYSRKLTGPQTQYTVTENNGLV